MNPEQGAETALAVHVTHWQTFAESCATPFFSSTTLKVNKRARSNETR